jgi:putative hydrolases of HD superfamily
MLCSSHDERFDRQLRFILEIDRLKGIARRSDVLGGARKENSAEHSWHVAMMALLLAEYADEPIDRARVVRLLLVHDLVEIDAGDTYIHDAAGNLSKPAREQAAADRLFALLPPDQGVELRGLWEEYEAGQTAEARFAGSLDRLMPLLHNMATAGRSWREHGVTAEQVRARVLPSLQMGCRRLWHYAEDAVATAERCGFTAPDHPAPADG